MKTNDTKQQRPENEAMQQFRQYINQNYVNKPIPGSDKEFRSSLELVWLMRDTLASLTIGDVSKVMGEMQFETTSFGGFVTWVLYRIDGERLLEQDFGMKT